MVGISSKCFQVRLLCSSGTSAPSEGYKRKYEDNERDYEVIRAEDNPDRSLTLNDILVMMCDKREINSDSHNSKEVDNKHHDNALEDRIFLDNPRDKEEYSTDEDLLEELDEDENVADYVVGVEEIEDYF